jgi:hypothetical protein
MLSFFTISDANILISPMRAVGGFGNNLVPKDLSNYQDSILINENRLRRIGMREEGKTATHTIVFWPFGRVVTSHRSKIPLEGRVFGRFGKACLSQWRNCFKTSWTTWRNGLFIAPSIVDGIVKDR